jgi:hypothetical protein
VITAPVDITFDWIWRHASGSADTILAEWSDHYVPRGAGDFDPQPFRYDESCDAVDFESGDLVVLRYTGSNSTSAEGYIPNGDNTAGSDDTTDPNITLPN